MITLKITTQKNLPIKQIIFLIIMITGTSTIAQSISNMDASRNIKNQFYITVGKGKLSDQKEPGISDYSILSADIGGLFYLNKKNAKHIFYGINWTALSASVVEEQTALVGMQLGPEFSMKITKGIVLSLGYQYKYGAILESFADNPQTSNRYSSNNIHSTLKVGPILTKIEYQFLNILTTQTNSINTIFNISLGLSI